MATDDRSTCIDETLGREVFRWAMLGGVGTPQEPRLAEHVAQCDACSETLPEWTFKAKAGRITGEARDIIAAAETSPSTVITFRSGGLTYYFRRLAPDSQIGTLVVTNRAGQIVRVETPAFDGSDE